MRRWSGVNRSWRGEYFLVVQLLSHVWLFDTPWTVALLASLFLTTSRRLSKFLSIASVIQPSHPLSPTSPPALSLSQHQGLFQWVSSLHQVAKRLEFQLQHQSYQQVFRVWFPLGWTGWISLQSKGLSGAFSITAVRRHQFFGALPSLWSSSHIHTWPLRRPQPWLYGSMLAEECPCFSTGCLGGSLLPCREAIAFWFHGCTHHPQWF